MKKIMLALALAVPLFVSSCKKKDSDVATPYSKTINGVNFKTIDAAPAGSMGSADVNTESDSFSMVAYPIPCSTTLDVMLSSKNTAQLTANAKLVNVIYTSMPQPWVSPFDGHSYNITIENNAKAGNVALEVDGLSVGMGSYNHLTMDVTSLPQGFYRLYIETSDGKSFWDNTWIFRY